MDLSTLPAHRVRRNRNTHRQPCVGPHGQRPRSAPGKKPAAPSVSRRHAAARPNITARIADEIHTALERLDADEELLAIVGSWGDTLDDADVLTMLRDYNAGRPILHRAH